MPRQNRQNIDRKTNKPNPKRTEGIFNDPLLNRADQIRRDDDVIRTVKRTVFDIDYAIKWYIENEIQPQITADFIISSNHFYVFILVSIIGFFTFIKINQVKNLMLYLILSSIVLEFLHIIIPQRTFQWSDLFGNLIGVLVVILTRNIINKYEVFKK